MIEFLNEVAANYPETFQQTVLFLGAVLIGLFFLTLNMISGNLLLRELKRFWQQIIGQKENLINLVDEEDDRLIIRLDKAQDFLSAKQLAHVLPLIIEAAYQGLDLVIVTGETKTEYVVEKDTDPTYPSNPGN